jgi:methionyl-tRNA formyltransferase
MSEIQNFSGSGERILFFGRAKCDASETLLRKLIRYKFNVTYIESKSRREKIPKDILRWEGEYILCFRSLFVLPKILLDRAKVAAINFHPAPPEYPGSGCINFALYENAKQYGVTAHIMNEKVDNGEILEVRRFPIGSFDDLPVVLARAHSELSNLCSDFINAIYLVGERLIEEKINLSIHKKWNGEARLLKDLNALQTISISVSEEELKRIIRATYIKDYPPKVEIHGFKFYLSLDES